MDYVTWTLAVALITFIFVKSVKKRQHFKKWGIPQPFEIPYIGYMGANVFTGKNPIIASKELYDMNKEAKYIVYHLFGNPVLMLRDTELIKSALIKNFDNFADHKIYVDADTDPLFGQNLAYVNGDRWRELRNLLSPSFTTSKIRMMYSLMSSCAKNFVDQFVKIHNDSEAIDIKDAFSRYANDVIATCAFGIEIDSLKNPDNEFYTRGRKATNFTSTPFIKIIMITAFPKLMMKLGLRFISKEETDYFVKVIESTIQTRELQNIKRPDMLQLLMEERDKTNELNMLELAAQAFIFFLGGFETTSGHMCLIAHELAVNPETQARVQCEIDAVMAQSSDEPTYDMINNMAYLDAVFYECMRKHPPPTLNRICTKDFELPPALPNSKPFVVKEGMELIVPVYAIQNDSDIYENPDTFDPERFYNKKISISDPTFLGFGLGPRMCIGNRFALLETKVLFVHLLYKCSLVPCKKTPVPLEYANYTFIPAAKNGFWLQIKQRN